MKKVKAMAEARKIETTAKPVVAKKTHVTLVKPADRVRDPGGGCRPTGIQ